LTVIDRICLLRCADVKTSISKEILMRIPALAILATIAVLTALPAQAQTFGGNAPVCLHQYYWGGGETYYCSYTSFAQCNATASGLSATCVENPYFANAQIPRGPAYRQPRRAY
jgi:hypothetical protein